MDKEDKQIINRAIKENWRIGDRTRLKRLLTKNLKLYRKNVELEKENEQLKSIVEFQQSSNMKRHFQILELKKGNAELKAKNKWYSEQVCNKECAEVWGNLTKAKEIIEKIEKIFYSGEEALKRLSKISDILEQAEQFLEKVK